MLTTVPIPGTKANTTAGKMYVFDISFVDQTTQTYYLADRSNAVVDVVDARTNQLISQIDATPAFKGWKIVDGRLLPPPCDKTLGIEYVQIDGERGTVELKFEAKPEFLNPAGNVQGGFLAAMLDNTMGPALAATLDAGEFAPTLNLYVQFGMKRTCRLHCAMSAFRGEADMA